MPEALPLRLNLGEHDSVAALLLTPARPLVSLVFAHGAGAGMQHFFMDAISHRLAVHRVATLRYQFPFMERGLKRPDSAAVAERAVRAAVAEAVLRLGDVPMFAGGKSFGGRMSSQAQAHVPLPGVRGVVFFGFPLHPAGQPATKRGDHLMQVQCPMLFLQGSRDALANIDLVHALVDSLGERAQLRRFDDADHAFHVRVRSGTTDAAVLQALADTAADWMLTQARGARPMGESG